MMLYYFEWLYIALFGLYAFACIVALRVNYKLKSNGFSGIRYKECFFPDKHFSFFIGYLISLIPLYIIDQYALRFYDPVCSNCIVSGTCVNEDGEKGCGCNPKAKACSPFETCSFFYWGPIIFNKNKAEEHLKNLNYKILVEYAKRTGEGT